MADVFLSYARSDRAIAERLASAIEETGLGVWWDRHIKGGAEYSRDIERQLDAAKRVLVLWSKDAVNSRWVRDEASEAAESGRLVGATIDGTPPPLGFRQFQTVDLQAWAAKGAAIPAELAEALEVDASAPASVAAPRAPRRSRVIAGIAALLIALAAALVVIRPAPFDRWLSGEQADQGVALAIMPFTTGSADTAYLGAGLSGALADSLSALSGLKITASTSTQALAGKGLTVPDLAQKLRVSHLVEGGIIKTGEGFAVSIRLIEGRSSQQIWARSFAGSADQLQQLKGRMARELAGALSARLGVGQGEIAERRNVDPRAYEAYLRALEQVSARDDDDARLEAIKQFRLATSIEPDFADAHAGYAYLMALSVPQQLQMPWKEISAEQHRATDRALALDPDNKLALVARSAALQNFDGDVDRSVAVTQAVLKRSPNYGPAHYVLAAGYLMGGKSREALDHLEQAIDRNPFDSLLRFYRAKIFYSLGDYAAVRKEQAECTENCGRFDFMWSLALIGFGTADQYREDFPDIVSGATAAGLPAALIEEIRRVSEAFILGRPYAMAKLDDERDMNFVNAAFAARLIGFEEGLRYARVAADRQQPDSVIDILNDGRATFTAEQRADPRYHALFRHPRLVDIAAARRANAVTAGLPVFPVKPYTGR